MPQGQEVASWLVFDHRFRRRYGIGFAKPFPPPLTPYLRSGYLKRGRMIEELAGACGIAPAALTENVEAFNDSSCRGDDPAFRRGSTP